MKRTFGLPILAGLLSSAALVVAGATYALTSNGPGPTQNDPQDQQGKAVAALTVAAPTVESESTPTPYQNWLLSNSNTAIPGPERLADRQDCEQIRDTPYRSPEERDYFHSHCESLSTSQGPATGSAQSGNSASEAPLTQSQLNALCLPFNFVFLGVVDLSGNLVAYDCGPPTLNGSTVDYVQCKLSGSDDSYLRECVMFHKDGLVVTCVDGTGLWQNFGGCGVGSGFLEIVENGRVSELFRTASQFIAPPSGQPGPGESANETAPGGASIPGDFCSTHECIDNFENGKGYIVQCNDGKWSQSGGRQGACSQHGGVAN
ncbi:MAG TPA: hypothetical protein VFS30_01050 [Dehalococcoidia bacterium]|nr:hypothetical protein [Dehalococcoidia bacterium]